MQSNIPDLPLDGKTENYAFDIRAYQEAIVEFIRNAEAPLTIALQGEWGSGKSTLMTFIKENLTGADNPYYAIEINTWQYSMLCNPDQAVIGILQSILNQMGNKDPSKKEIFKAISGKLLTFAATASTNILGQLVAVPEVGSSILEAYKSCKNGDKGFTLNDILPASSIAEELKKKIKNAIDQVFPSGSNNENSPRGFLFFIDDLDRIDPPVAVKILELLKNIFDLPKCIFVLAIDYNVVIKGLKPKFGELTQQNEREFRSFFDKIIQLPFLMPISSYKIDRYLTDNLEKVGFLSEQEKDNHELTALLSEFAHLSVGNNPRSLIRLMNSLSLIRFIIEKTTKDKTDDRIFQQFKALIFALVCIQNTYPTIYKALSIEPDFREWDSEIVQKFSLPEIQNNVLEQLRKNNEFNEQWEQILFRLCMNDHFLSQRVLDISHMLNKILQIIPEDKNPGDCLNKVMCLSSVTNVQASEQQNEPVNTDFHQSTWLKKYRDKFLPAVNSMLGDSESIISTNQRVQTTLYLQHKKNNTPVSNISFSLSFDGNKKQFVAGWSCGVTLFKGSSTTNWDDAEREIGAVGAWNKIKEDFAILKSCYNADHDINRHLNIGNGGSFVWFKLYCNSLEEMVSPETIEKHAMFFAEFVEILSRFEQLENTPAFKEHFFGLKQYCEENGYAPFTKMWIWRWDVLVIDHFCYKDSELSLDIGFEQDGFVAQLWDRKGNKNIIEEVLDKAGIRGEFDFFDGGRYNKKMKYTEAKAFVSRICAALRQLS